MADREIEFFFDIGSSYSYLAATQMDGVAERTKVPVRWRPFLLGGVFKATGNDMPARLPAKAKWMLHDMTLWANHYEIPFRMPSRFPLLTLRTQRALAAAERLAPTALPAFARALFTAYWGDDQDVTTDPVIAAAARSAKLDADAIIAAIDAPETKDLLRATTEEAVRRGAFGAPALFVGDALFWATIAFRSSSVTSRGAEVADAPPPGPGDPNCPHLQRHEGVCMACGHCNHEVILNGACFLCGTTDLDPIALSPKKGLLIAPDQLVRKK